MDSVALGRYVLPALETLAGWLPHLRCATLCTADGFNVCSIGITEKQLGRLAALAGSLLVGGLLWWAAAAGRFGWFALLPLWMFLRMALNAIDGMLAREFGQQSALGAYLNELCDVLADAALFLPFVLVAPFGWGGVGGLIFLATVSEMAGALGPMVGAPRQYDGPLGKSDRAFLFGLLGLWLGLDGALPSALFWLMPLAQAALLLNIVNRIRSGLRARPASVPPH